MIPRYEHYTTLLMRPAGSQSYEVNKLRVDYLETFRTFYDFSRLADTAAAYCLHISAQ